MQGQRQLQQLGPAHLPKREILKRPPQFSQVRHRGVAHAGRLLVLNILPAPDGCQRLGVITGRRYHLRANRRNLARRRMREAYRLLRPAIREPYWVVLIARRYLQDAGTAEVQAELALLLRRAGALPAKASHS